MSRRQFAPGLVAVRCRLWDFIRPHYSWERGTKNVSMVSISFSPSAQLEMTHDS